MDGNGLTLTAFREKISLFPEFQIVDDVNCRLNDMDSKFNFLAVIPVVGAVTSAFRVVMGIVCLLATAVLRLVAEIAIAIAKSKNDEEALLKWTFLAYLGKEYMAQVSLEIFVGLAQTAAAITTLGLANLLYVIPNAREGKDWFAPRIPYQSRDETASAYTFDLTERGIIHC